MAKYSSIYAQQETLEITQVGGSDACKIRLTDSRDKESFLYFSLQSALLVRSDVVVSTPLGNVPTTTFINSYTEIEGYMQPSRVTIDQAGQEISFELNTVTFDDVSEDSFIPPAEIQALLN